jgi:hypothetical protein
VLHKFHHSTLFAGEPTAAAGNVKVWIAEDGSRQVKFDDGSGHYKPSTPEMVHVAKTILATMAKLRTDLGGAAQPPQYVRTKNINFGNTVKGTTTSLSDLVASFGDAALKASLVAAQTWEGAVAVAAAPGPAQDAAAPVPVQVVATTTTTTTTTTVKPVPKPPLRVAKEQLERRPRQAAEVSAASSEPCDCDCSAVEGIVKRNLCARARTPQLCTKANGVCK